MILVMEECGFTLRSSSATGSKYSSGTKNTKQLSNKHVHQNPQGPSCASTWHGVVQAGTAWHGPSLEDSAVFTLPSSTQIARKPIQALQVLPPPPYISFLPHLPSTD
ncbi:hypothetical protein ROHU_022499 [Labeo rohita]|uniref:Uncharacterized protein n=1 Tax=Labeo rohita TaxID=84645 RepID=A0A498MT64_LABRO|nr:hypothetical protein ROHU_022499 [Labeo rohita]